VAANSPVDYVDETSATTQAAVETYPEPIQSAPGSNLNGFEINQFFPWTINQDGTGEETLNHIGRHELRFAVNKTYTNDANLVALQQPGGKNFLSNFFQMREDPAHPGRYLGVDAPEFGTHSSGQIVAITAASGGNLLNAEDMTLQYVNAKQLSNVVGAPPGIGHFRDPLPRADGTLVASFANTFPAEPNTATATYNFRLVTLNKNLTANGDSVNSGFLTPGATKTVSYYVGANLVTQTNVAMWELQPVEVTTRTTPPTKLQPPLASPEQKAFLAAGVLEADIRNYLDKNDLALVVMRNVAQRDDIDRQQPFNLHVLGGLTMLANPPTGGTTYDMQWLQFFEADQVRAYGTPPGGINGRRTMPRPLNDPAALIANRPDGIGANPGGKDIAIDSSVAAFVPAQRAITWQSLSPGNTGVVRERYWVEFQKGEIRACDSCHGVNKLNQHGDAVYPAAGTIEPPPPQALIDLLNWWKTHADRIFAHDFESCCTP